MILTEPLRSLQTKEVFRTELGLRSLVAHRYLWDMIEKLCSQQETSDFSFAVKLHKAKINQLAAENVSPDASSGGGNCIDEVILNTLRSDADNQWQFAMDHAMAYEKGAGECLGQQVVEDRDFTHREHQQYKWLHVQSAYNHRVAASLSGRGNTRNNEMKTLFGK